MATLVLTLTVNNVQGKSTFFKQVNLSKRIFWSREALLDYRMIIFGTILKYIRAISECITIRKIPNQCQAAMSEVLDLDDDFVMYVHKIWNNELMEHINTIWKSEAAQQVFMDRHKLQHLFHGEAMQHYMNQFDNMKDPEWTPSIQDVLLCRTKTTGIVSTELELGNTKLEFVDVGGGRGERRSKNALYN